MEQAGTRTMPKRRRGEQHDDDGRGRAAANKKHRRGPQEQQRRLYLIFDDWAWGYSIREINLSSSSAADKGTAATALRPPPRHLPPPFIQVEAQREYPHYFAAVGTKILATQRRSLWDEDSVPEGFLPIIDVRSRSVNFGPGKECQDIPIFLPVGDDEVFSLDMMALRALSLKPLSCPPRQEDHFSCHMIRWSWRERELSCLPFQRTHITSYAVHPDERTILVSTDKLDLDMWMGKEAILALGTDMFDMLKGEEATFALDTDKFDDMVEGKEEQLAVWTRLGDWSLPFAGRAHFVHCLNAFVGLSKDPASLGHLCCSSCDSKEAAAADTDIDSRRPPPAWKLGKEMLFSDDPAETHVGATLVHMGGSEFCLVQCVSSSIGVGDDVGSATDDDPDDEELIDEEIQHKDGIIQHKEEDTNELEEGDSTADGHEQQQLEKEEGGDEAPQGCSKRRRYLYRLTTFSLCYDDNGDLTTGDTCRMQCYKVPDEITEQYFLISDPVAFWL